MALLIALLSRGESLNCRQADGIAIIPAGPLATAITKMLINAAEGEEVERALEALAGLAVAGGPELKAGVAAFREKRKPEFYGTTSITC